MILTIDTLKSRVHSWKEAAKKLPGLVYLKRYITKYILPTRKASKPKINLYMTRPFCMDDLEPVPKEWRIGEGPDFVGIAAGKAGTTWWYELLKEHPQIVQNRLNAKELGYFHHFKYYGLSDEQVMTYRMAFAAPKGAICGEWSPGYLVHPFCTEYLKVAAPNTKILVLLRNPVDRVLSSINHMSQVIGKYYDFEPEQRYVYDVFDLNPTEIRDCRYSEGLKQLLRHFNHDQILILQYEKCKADPIQEIARTYRFLGVNDQYQPSDVKRIRNQKQYYVSPLTPNERQRFASYFSDDVHTLVKLFPDIDLSLWPDFS
jgi:hypothetical protein